MEGATLSELRELSRRSRRTQRAAWLAVLGALLGVPLVAALPSAALAFGLVALAGAALVHYAWRAGEERGAYRRLFREVKERARGSQEKEESGARAPGV